VEPPSTFFTDSPQWRWLIVFYFFIGGITGGAYFLAAMIDVLGRPAERALARLGYYIALPGVIVCGILLIVDLTRPLRFWHMLLESETWQPMFKWYSPMSVGSWALLLFGVFAAGSFLAALAEAGRWRAVARGRWLSPFRPPGVIGTLWTALGGMLGFFLAGYTGVLLMVTNRPVWSDTPLVGLVFLLSGASTAIALLILLGRRDRWAAPGVVTLTRLDTWVLLMELVAIIALVVTVAPILPRVWLNGWGVLFLLGVVVLGILLPLYLEWRAASSRWSIPAAAVLVLIGGFVLRVVMVLSVHDIGVTV
jgi:formate-dependent nitrite reductase membrane component NrfD